MLTYDPAGSYVPVLSIADVFRYYTPTECGPLECLLRDKWCGGPNSTPDRYDLTGNTHIDSITMNTANV